MMAEGSLEALRTPKASPARSVVVMMSPSDGSVLATAWAAFSWAAVRASAWSAAACWVSPKRAHEVEDPSATEPEASTASVVPTTACHASVRPFTMRPGDEMSQRPDRMVPKSRLAMPSPSSVTASVMFSIAGSIDPPMAS